MASGNYEKLATRLLTAPEFKGKTVVVCWVHQSLPQFATALGVQPEPRAWKDGDYNGVYRVRFPKGKAQLVVTHAH